MRVLIVSQCFPPLKFIATVRITEVANQFAKNGYEVTAITTNNYKYFPVDKFDLDKNIRIKRSNSWDFLLIRFRLGLFAAAIKKLVSGKSDDKIHATEPANGGRKSKITTAKASFFSFLANYLPFSLFFGDGNFIYIITSFFKILPLVEKDTIIFTSFRPYSDHIIGYLVKLFRPSATWICDFRDPHLPPNAKNIFFSFHAWLNKRICRRANIVTTVSNGVAKNLAGYNDKLYILRNGIVGNLTQTAKRPVSDRFNIIYTGGMYEGTRNPAALFRSLSVLLKKGKIDPSLLRIIYAGGDKQIWDDFVADHQLEAINESFGMLSREESKQLQESASINLLLTWADKKYKGVLTGKMYEYFRAGKPIITIINGDRDEEIEEILEQTKSGPVVYNDGNTETLINFILGQYEAFIAGLEPKMMDEASLKQFQWDHFFPEFLKDLNLKKPKPQVQHAV